MDNQRRIGEQAREHFTTVDKVTWRIFIIPSDAT